MNDALLLRVRLFAAIVTEADLHGLAFQHLALCRRRAWLHLHRIDYAHLDGRMQRGLALHDANKPRDRSVVGLIGLAPDRIDWRATLRLRGERRRRCSRRRIAAGRVLRLDAVGRAGCAMDGGHCTS